jgi:lipopolysaccharide transport protein LptA|tara:strand:+ start:232 stop:645 length:414 start_codon:yes stop_codon:yes gene_type:complete
LNNKILVLITLSIFLSFVLHAVEINNDIKIKSDSIEFLKENNQISFLNNVEIRSNSVRIVANSATYDDFKNVISISGRPSRIESSMKDTVFSGKANKILFFNDEKIHLIGNASMKYESISIASDLIIFNPQTGKLSS